MALKEYKEKRNFAKTPEPKGTVHKADKVLKFVVQRHWASHLHYDLRLEMEGVLKSWAVPKGPSMHPDTKRLAMMTEDHPYEYLTFAGVIPEGYGAGIMEVWDTGSYEPSEGSGERELLKGLYKGELKFTLKGKKLKGDFVLIKTPDRAENAWLLKKVEDNYAVDEEYDAEDHIDPKSEIPKGGGKKPERERKIKVLNAEAAEEPVSIPEEAEKKPFPGFIEPMLAKLVDEPFDDAKWLFELKWDGYRACAVIKNGKVDLYSRTEKLYKKYKDVNEALEKLDFDAVVDGEVVVLDEEGNPNFQLMQNYLSNKDKQLAYFAFDLLYYNGYNLTSVPLIKRKELLQKIWPVNATLRYSEHFEKVGKKVFAFAQKNKLEGIIGKRQDSPYRPGYRSNDWVKIKTEMEQTGIVIGYTKPEKSRQYIGALVLGAYKDGELIHIGSSGGGIKTKELKKLYEQLKPLETDKKPVKGKVDKRGEVVWVKPKLVCEVSFSDWTDEGTMRHPKFKGMREDKELKDVTVEFEQDTEEVVEQAEKEGNFDKEEPKPNMAKAKKDSKSKAKIDPDKEEQVITLKGVDIKLTSLNKPWWPDDKLFKRDLIEYYLTVADTILPYLKDRPISQFRTPDGLKGEGFFKKDMGDTAPEWAKTVEIERESKEGVWINYMLCNDLPSLIYLAQVGCIEINPWNSRVKSADKPDWIVIDIDPSDKNTFEDVITVAQAVKEVIDKLKIEGYPKTSGSSGIHVYIPLGAKYDYEQGRLFANLVADMTHKLVPKITTLERSLSKRKKTEIYVDYLQNSRGQTLAAPYSARPKPGATVSAPLKWDEVKSGLRREDFTIINMPDRIKKEGDLFKGTLGKGVDIKAALERL